MNPRTDPEDTTWTDSDPVAYLEEDMDDDTLPDDFDLADDVHELEFDAEPRPKHFTPKQRIEMIREQRWLQSLMADFEDFDRIDGFRGLYGEELSY